jgi:hypothetical protein
MKKLGALLYLVTRFIPENQQTNDTFFTAKPTSFQVDSQGVSSESYRLNNNMDQDTMEKTILTIIPGKTRELLDRHGSLSQHEVSTFLY